MVRALLAAVVVMAITAVADTLSIAGTGVSNIQPASGETWRIVSVTRLSPANLGYQHYDGTDIGERNALFEEGSNGAFAMGDVLTNTHYARFVNDAGSSKIGAYRGVKL